MPSSSLFADLSGGGSLVEDQRAFQLALELSMLSLGEPMPAGPLGSPLGFAPQQDDRAKKSQNMTECVPVPSSEHVAEIVGRQGSCAPLLLNRDSVISTASVGQKSTDKEVRGTRYLGLILFGSVENRLSMIPSCDSDEGEKVGEITLILLGGSVDHVP
ncbi:RNA-binding protein MEX3B [Operophtera brumata]|uniref:RNA-binding protein MEX3B n=1 Tax=Operophtera brumata TaxID=104452 RepID=A0A0L7LSG8_OPEBR|nr:RNA-binding protein MEX3B [Operophtera brumata]